MDNVSRFGVFLPTYIWADDGPSAREHRGSPGASRSSLRSLS